ncbi:MAG: hypothetical protein KKD44_03075 [Proteobacteria bacterium]|nr:hypothetical protein [Pseudomonadota bacterium]
MDATGMTTHYDYDALKRLSTVTREHLNENIITTYTYDALGRKQTQTVTGGGSNKSDRLCP